MPKYKRPIETTRSSSRRQASKEAIKQMQLLLDDEEEDAFVIPDEDDNKEKDVALEACKKRSVSPIMEPPPKKKYKLSHRKSSDGNDRDVIVLKSISNSNYVPKDNSLELECFVEELSEVQKEYHRKFEAEEKELQKKIDELLKGKHSELVYKGEFSSAVEVNELIARDGKKTLFKPSQLPELGSANADNEPAYQLVMDPQLGIIVGTVQKSVKQVQMPPPPPMVKNKLQISPAVKPMATMQSEIDTPPIRRTRRGTISPAVTAPLQTKANNTTTVQTKANNTPPVQTGASKSAPVQTRSNNTPPVQTRANNIPPVQTRANNTPPVQTRANNTPSVQTRANNAPPVQTRANNTPPIQTRANNTPPVQTRGNNVNTTRGNTATPSRGNNVILTRGNSVIQTRGSNTAPTKSNTMPTRSSITPSKGSNPIPTRASNVTPSRAVNQAASTPVIIPSIQTRAMKTPTTVQTRNSKATPASKRPIEDVPIEKSKQVVDLTSDDNRNQVDNREISFNKLQGKTYPSLVVVARPHLRVTDLGADRSQLDSKVKSVLMHAPTKFTEWLIQQGLIKAEQKCPVHTNTELKLGMYSDVSKFPFSGGYVWISECCPQRFISVFNGSLFEGSPHPPMVILKLIYHWSCQTNIQNVTQWVKVDNLFVKCVYTWLRGICTMAVQSKIRQLGGPGSRIEVGVISLGTTSHDGNQRQVKVEVLGILESSSKYMRLRAVEPMADGERNFRKKFSKILEPIVQWVHPASTIVTDLTVDKATLHQMGFSNVIQTTSNEYNNSNRTIMEYLRRIVPRMFQNTLSLLSRQIIQQFLDELVWREWFGTTAQQGFDNIILHLADQTRMNSQITLISKLNKVAANPFKSWISTPATNPASQTVSTTTTSTTNNPPPPAAPAKTQVAEVKRYGRGRKSNSPQVPVVQERPTKPVSPDVPEQMVPLENYYYGTIESFDNPLPKVTLNMKCPFCKNTFDNNVELQDHLFRHAHNVSDDVYLCRYCLTSVSTANEERHHVNKFHPGQTKFDNGFVCLICETHYMNPFVLGKHMSKEHSPHELPYECGSCSFRCSNHKQVIDHFYVKHDGGSTIQCPFCLKSTTVWSGGRNISQNVHYFIQHLQRHQKKQLAKRCGKCNLWFVQKEVLKEHQQKMHLSLRGRLGLVPCSSPRNGVMVPKSKVDKNPCDAEIINFSSLFYDIPNKSICKECDQVITSAKHFPSFDSCQNPNCQYSTCCATAMMTHNATCKGLNSVIPPETLPYEMFCVCGHKDSDGNSMAKHLAVCEKKSSYPSQAEAKSATVMHSMLDILGLVRKPEETKEKDEPSQIKVRTEENLASLAKKLKTQPNINLLSDDDEVDLKKDEKKYKKENQVKEKNNENVELETDRKKSGDDQHHPVDKEGGNGNDEEIKEVKSSEVKETNYDDLIDSEVSRQNTVILIPENDEVEEESSSKEKPLIVRDKGSDEEGNDFRGVDESSMKSDEVHDNEPDGNENIEETCPNEDLVDVSRQNQENSHSPMDTDDNNEETDRETQNDIVVIDLLAKTSEEESNREKQNDVDVTDVTAEASEEASNSEKQNEGGVIDVLSEASEEASNGEKQNEVGETDTLAETSEEASNSEKQNEVIAINVSAETSNNQKHNDVGMIDGLAETSEEASNSAEQNEDSEIDRIGETPEVTSNSEKQNEVSVIDGITEILEEAPNREEQNEVGVIDHIGETSEEASNNTLLEESSRAGEVIHKESIESDEGPTADSSNKNEGTSEVEKKCDEYMTQGCNTLNDNYEENIDATQTDDHVEVKSLEESLSKGPVNENLHETVLNDIFSSAGNETAMDVDFGSELTDMQEVAMQVD